MQDEDLARLRALPNDHPFKKAIREAMAAFETAVTYAPDDIGYIGSVRKQKIA